MKKQKATAACIMALSVFALLFATYLIFVFPKTMESWYGRPRELTSFEMFLIDISWLCRNLTYLVYGGLILALGLSYKWFLVCGKTDDCAASPDNANSINTPNSNGLNRVKQWCGVSWLFVGIGIMVFMLSDIIFLIFGGVLVASGLMCSIIASFLACIGLVFPEGATWLKFLGLLFASFGLPLLLCLILSFSLFT